MIRLRLVSSNIDKSNISTADLWASLKDLKSIESHMTLRFLADDDTSLLESEDSDYVDKYEEETEDESVRAIDFDKDINRDGSDKEQTEDEDAKGSSVDVNEEDLGEDEFDKEESEESDNFDRSDEVEIEYEDVKGLGVKIVDIDDEYEISDLEL